LRGPGAPSRFGDKLSLDPLEKPAFDIWAGRARLDAFREAPLSRPAALMVIDWRG
jgi:hypothetical protein